MERVLLDLLVVVAGLLDVFDIFEDSESLGLFEK